MSKNTLTSGLINYITYSSGSLSTSGSLTVTGSLNATNGITGSFQGVATTASYVLNAVSASFATTASYAVSASITTNAVTASYALNAVSSSFATTAVTSSFANAFTVAGTLTATTLVVQTITSSVDFVTGSTRFGSLLANTHAFTGSVGMTGSLAVIGNVGVGTTSPAAELQVGKASDVTIAMSNSNSVTSGTRGNIVWYNSSVSTVAAIKAVAVTDNVGTELQFFTRPAAGSLTQVLTIASTGAATFSGAINSSASAVFNGTGRGISYQYCDMTNTSGRLILGLEGSTAGNAFPNSEAYSVNIGTDQNQAFGVFTNNLRRLTIASTGAATFSSTIISNSSTNALNVGNSQNSAIALSTFGKTSTSGYATANNYLQIGAGENATNSTRLIGFGYSITANTNQPAYIGYIETSNAGETKGSLIFGTRDATTDIAPTTRLTIASTGAATFSSSVTAQSLDVISSSGVGSSSASGLARFITAGTTTAISIGQSTAARRMDIGNYYISVTGEQFELTTASSQPMILSTNSTPRLTIASTGAATFSGIVRSTGAAAESTGSGAEVAFSGGIGYFLAYNRSASAYLPVGINGSTVTISSGASATVAMTITDGGNVLIGRTTSGLTNGDGVTIGGGSIQPESTGYVFYGNRTTTDGLFMGIRRNNVDVGSISVTTSATAFNTSSDYRLKTDFKEFNALSIIDSITTYDFAWKIDNTRAYGVKAHELKQIVPYVVFGEKDEINEDDSIKPQAVDYSKLVPVLVKAIQELKAEINELKNK